MKVQRIAKNCKKVFACTFDNYSKGGKAEMQAVYTPKIRLLVISLVSRKEKNGREEGERECVVYICVIVLFLITLRDEARE